MEKVLILLFLKWCLVYSKEIQSDKDLESSNSRKIVYEYAAPLLEVSDVYNANQQSYGYLQPNSPQYPKIDLHAIVDGNPLLAALLLGASLGLSPKPATPNHPELLPVNPYIALLLSQYGRYVPFHGAARGIYGYAVANNFHNNKPFGAYKVYEDSK